MKCAQNIKIENKVVGNGGPVFIIAEIGVNHNGSLSIAKKMIKAAANCGVNAIKFQTFKTEEFLADNKIIYSYISRGEMVRESMFEMFKRLELPDAWHKELFDYTRELGTIPLSSAADIQAIRLLKKLGVGAIKIASEDLTNVSLIEEAARSNLPVILSTGMANQEEISKALRIFEKAGNSRVIILHCTSIYPTPAREANILRIKALTREFDCLIGFSDHTEGNIAALGATALGSVMVEKHFTLDKTMEGPDHRFSADPAELRSLVKSIRTLEKMMGKGQIQPSRIELGSLKWCRRSIMSDSDIPKGAILNKDLLCFKRPGTGISPQDLNLILGKKVKRDIKRGMQIRFTDLTGVK